MSLRTLLLKRLVGKLVTEGKEQRELSLRDHVHRTMHKHLNQQEGKHHHGLSEARVGIKSSA